jgi:hypothetical protein
MPTPTFTVNVSSINDFMTCRWRWVAKWVYNRVPRDEARPLRFGKLFHLIFEDYLTGKNSMAGALASRRTEWLAVASTTGDEDERRVALEAVDDLDSFSEPMCLWFDTYPFEIATLECEVPFIIPHPMDDSILLRGRPDRVGVMYGQTWHVQNRSLNAGTNFALYIDLARRNYHEHLYAEHIVKKYPQYPYGGTLFNLFRKLKYRSKPTKKEIEAGMLGKELHTMDEMFWQHPMVVALDSSLHESVMGHILGHAINMRETKQRVLDGSPWPAPNERMNGGFYGNSIDPFYRVLTGEITLDDDRYFQTREDTYAVESESVS